MFPGESGALSVSSEARNFMLFSLGVSPVCFRSTVVCFGTVHMEKCQILKATSLIINITCMVERKHKSDLICSNS